MIRRRDFLRHGATAATLGLMPASALLAQTPAATMQPLAGGTALFTGTGGNVVVRKAANGELLVIDGGLAAGAKVLRKAIEDGMDSRRITTLINTHWHPEQTGLNMELGNRRTRIFAHENTRQWLGTSIRRLGEEHTYAPLPESARPNEVFYHYGDFRHGDVPVEYGYLRQAHTDGDMYVFLPADNVLHAGGVIATDGWPFMDWWTGGWIGGVVDAVETLLSIADDNTIVVPASGPVTDRAGLLAMRDMYAEIFGKVRTGFMQANTVEQNVAARPAGPWENQYGNADAFIAQSHWSLIPHLTPDA